ncbi:MAG: hypothetical protein BAJALOKI1v1_250019 [Promethearchaeota archaeon]|nr:MAG: hypothetical protein BAJALOKI1v1_250019 [Candidatus Lokiarchaeota archaeon]
MSRKVRFIHAADIHLGKTLYGIPERYDDFFKAFAYLLKKAVFEEVDFILISGDLIDSERKIDSSTLGNIIKEIQDFQTLCKTKLKKEIPIICIEGNHETPFFSEHTWLKLLAELDLIILLSGEYDNENKKIRFADYSQRFHIGGKIKINNIIIYGLSYFGSSTPDLYPLLQNAIDNTDEFVILMMHFGIQGQDKRKKGLEVTKDLQALHNKVNYLALGHFHKQYQLPEHDPWIFNPGSLEVNEITEYTNDHGIFLVDIFPEEGNTYEIKPIFCFNGNPEPNDDLSIPNRKFLSFSPIDISKSKSFEEAQTIIINKLRKLGVPERGEYPPSLDNLDVPILYVSITGRIGYSELEVDLVQLKEKIFNTFELLGLRLYNNIFSKLNYELETQETWTLEKIEEEALLYTIEQEVPFKSHKKEISDLVLNQLKTKLTKSADYSVIKTNIDNWFSLHQDILNVVKKIVIQQKESQKIGQKKPYQKKFDKKAEKKKKAIQKQESIDQPWDEEDFSEEFENLKDILEMDGEEEELDKLLDDIIDDEDLNI